MNVHHDPADSHHAAVREHIESSNAMVLGVVLFNFTRPPLEERENAMHSVLPLILLFGLAANLPSV